MAHTLNGATIHIDEGGDIESREAIYAIQQVLDATVSTISFYGAASKRRHLEFILDENVNTNGKDNILNAVGADANVDYTNDLGSQGNFRLLSSSFKRKMAANLSEPVYEGSAELIAV